MNDIRQRVRHSLFLILFFFVCFSVFGVLLTFSSTGTSAPKLQFTKWQAGQGQEYTASNPPHTFITDTETTCEITATVAYAASQPSPVYPLTGYTWQVTGSHGYTFTTQMEASGPVGQMGTTFKLTATGTGDAHNSSTGGHRPMRGRSEKPIKFTVKFIGEYGTDPNNQQEISISVDFEQDKKDQIRQEYLDVRRLHETHRTADKNRQYGDLRIPSRGEFTKFGQRFNNGHYSYLINKSLEDKILHWWQACDKVAYEKLKNDDLKNDKGNKELRLTGGYRNPHHHVYHVYAGKPMASIKYWSLHQFGLALDVGAMDMNGKNGITNVDRAEMRDAAEDHAGASYSYYAGHVHAQWGAVRNAPGGSSNPSTRSTTNPPATTPTTVPGACGIHTISTSQAANHASVNFACGSHTYYACQTPSTSETNRHSYQTLPCGSHSGYRCTATSSHTQTTTCPSDTNGQSCSYGSYYACSPHTHAYPEPPPPSPPPPATVSCGRSACREAVSSTNEHRVGPCSACGKSYWSCGQYGSYHENQCRERTCRYGGCGNKWRRCQSSTPYCRNRPDRRCWAR